MRSLIFSLLAVSFVALASSANAWASCSDFSGNYHSAFSSYGLQVTISQNGCEEMTWSWTNGSLENGHPIFTAENRQPPYVYQFSMDGKWRSYGTHLGADYYLMGYFGARNDSDICITKKNPLNCTGPANDKLPNSLIIEKIRTYGNEHNTYGDVWVCELIHYVSVAGPRNRIECRQNGMGLGSQDVLIGEVKK
jgi:hypothetical protein